MNETPTEAPEAPVVEQTRPTQRRWLWLAALLAAAVIGVTVGIAITRNDDSPPTSTSAAQVANIRQACQRWMSTQSGGAPGDDWCRNMATWMNQQVASGEMMNTMMWGSPHQMAAACRQWTTSSTTPDDWCDQMVTWMSQNMNGNWDNSMMHGWGDN